MSPKRAGYGRTVTISVEEFVRRLKAGEKLKLVVYKRRKLVELAFPKGPLLFTNYRIPSSKTTSLYVHDFVIRSLVDGTYLNGQTKVEVMNGKPRFQIRNDGQTQVDSWQNNPTAALRAYFGTVRKEWHRSNNGKLHLPIQEPVIQAILKEYYKSELQDLDVYSEINTWDIREVNIRKQASSRRRRTSGEMDDDDTVDSLTNSDSDEPEEEEVTAPITPKVTRPRKRRTMTMMADDDDWSEKYVPTPIQPGTSPKRVRKSDIVDSNNKLKDSVRNLPEPLEISPSQSGLARFSGEISFEEPADDVDYFLLPHQELHLFATRQQQLIFNAPGY